MKPSFISAHFLEYAIILLSLEDSVKIQQRRNTCTSKSSNANLSKTAAGRPNYNIQPERNHHQHKESCVKDTPGVVAEFPQVHSHYLTSQAGDTMVQQYLHRA